jgi:hypothetical protein
VDGLFGNIPQISGLPMVFIRDAGKLVDSSHHKFKIMVYNMSSSNDGDYQAGATLVKSPIFNGKLWAVLLVVAFSALSVSYFNTGRFFSVFDRTRQINNPTDEQNKMFYTAVNYISSESVVEKIGFAFLNRGENIVAVQLDSGVKVDVSSIAQYNGATIRRFSEYAGIIYMYDGETVYRSNLKGENLRRTVLSTIQYEVMGDYIYSIKLYHGERRLYRCRLNGANEQLLFRHGVNRFWAYNGNLIMECSGGDNPLYAKFIFYNVVNGKSIDQLIPAGFAKICLDAGGIYYALVRGNEAGIYYRKYNEQIDTKIFDGEILDFAIGSKGMAILAERNGQVEVLGSNKGSGAWAVLGDVLFPLGSMIDVSQTHRYITTPKGEVWITRTEPVEWKRIY